MGLPRIRSPRASTGRRVALWLALAMGCILPSIGCQVEYAGMTLPSGKYMHDDVQYFESGPDFPWSNTQAAAQRARMKAMGIEPPPPPGTVPPAGGMQPELQTGIRGANVNEIPEPVRPAPAPQPVPPGAGALPGPGAPPPAQPPAPNVPPGGNPPGP
jgi:hypothetical protein